MQIQSRASTPPGFVRATRAAHSDPAPPPEPEQPQDTYGRLDFIMDRGIGLVAGSVVGTGIGAFAGQTLLGCVVGGLTGSIAVPLARMCGVLG